LHRCMHNLGLALQANGDLQEAEEIYARLLRLNENDNQGIRTLLVGLYLEQDRLDDAGKILERYEDDFQIEMFMSVIYLEMRSGKPAAVLKSHAEKISERNAFVLEQLAGVGSDEGEIEFSGYGIAIGSEAEAFEYADRYGGPWRRRKAIINAILKYVESA